MKYRIEYLGNRHCDFANGYKELLECLKLQKKEAIADIRKPYKSGASDSVREVTGRGKHLIIYAVLAAFICFILAT